MKIIDSIKFKMEERKKLLMLRDALVAAAIYQTPGCGGILKGLNGFFEEKAIARILRDNRIIVVNMEKVE